MSAANTDELEVSNEQEPLPETDNDILLTILGELKEQAVDQITEFKEILGKLLRNSEEIKSLVTAIETNQSLNFNTLRMQIDGLRFGISPTVQPVTPVVPVEPVRQIQRASFLQHYGSGYREKLSTHMFLSPTVTDADRIAWLEQHRAAGMTHFHISLYLDGDYGGKHKFCYEPKYAKYVRAWCQAIRDYGMEPVLWLMCDDGFTYFDRSNPDDVINHWNQAIEDVIQPMNILHIVPGLESIEYWDNAQHVRLFGYLKLKCPKAKLYLHTWADEFDWLDEGWYDVLAWQSDYSKPVEQNVEMIRKAIAATNGKQVVAAEHSKNGFEEAAKRRAEALIDAGAVGSWTG